MTALKISDHWTTLPVTEDIFGNFIEAGFGRQLSGMWSEMIFNRAFRDIPPYKVATYAWLGVDKEHYNENIPSWHSGYEEYNWIPFGNPDIRHLVGERTYKGKTALRVHNADGSLCGLTQQGLHLKKGQTYHFSILAGSAGKISQAGLNGFGITEHNDQQYPLTVTIGTMEKTFQLSTITDKYHWTFIANETAVCNISIHFQWKGTLALSCVSLMPADNINGWRKDVVDCLKAIAPPVIRFPGGCFASFYDWRSSIGDRDTREPMESFIWGGLEENDVGIDEFMTLSEEVGFQPQICVNMMTSIPFYGRQLVEYLNADENTGMGRLRMLNGHPKPYGVKFFEMDNEPGRKWTALQYAQQCVEFAREMRLADPQIELMMAAYEYPVEILPEMLHICGKEIQYVIYRQGEPDFVHKVLPIIRTYNEENGTSIRLVNTEWLPSCASIEPFDDPEIPSDFRWRGRIRNDYKAILSTFQTSWNYALNGAHTLLDFISYGGELASANFNNLCNTWGQNVIESTKDTAYLSCMGKVFQWFHQIFQPCTASDIETGSESIHAIAVRCVDGTEGIYIINHATSAATVTLPDGTWSSISGLKGRGRMDKMTESDTCVTTCTANPEANLAKLEPLSLYYFEKSTT